MQPGQNDQHEPCVDQGQAAAGCCQSQEHPEQETLELASVLSQLGRLPSHAAWVAASGQLHGHE